MMIPVLGNSLGVRAVGTKFIKSGQQFSGIGVNNFNLSMPSGYNASTTYADPAIDIAAISALGLPFIRLSFGMYDRSSWYNGWYLNQDAYFAALDKTVAAAEAYGVGLVPNLLWGLRTFTDASYYVTGVFEGPNKLADTSSNSWALFVQYVTSIVDRYKNSPAIYWWELANEATGNNGPEYYSTWAVDGTGVDGGAASLSFINWGTKPNGGTYSSSDKMSFTDWAKFTERATRLIKNLDPHQRMITSGCGQGNSFAVTAQTTNSIAADTLAKWNGSSATGFTSWTDYRDKAFDAHTSHVYPLSLANSQFFNADEKTGAQFIALYKGWADAANKPFFLGEFGSSYVVGPPDEISTDSTTETTNFNALLSAVVSNNIQLSAAWNYGGSLTGQTWAKWVMNDPTRRYQIEAIAAQNALMNN
jgi:hypothetical protein